MRMIQTLNNIINYFFKALRVITIAIAVIFWICLWLILYIFYKATSKTRTKGFNHPNFTLLTWIMAINKKYKSVIF